MTDMTDDALSAIVSQEIQQAMGGDSSELQENRKKALQYYHADSDAFAGEDGKSKAVDSSLADAVEWIMPQLMSTFCGSDEVVRFDPVNTQDEKQAELESDYVNHVVRKENNAYIIFNTIFRDALILKNGITKTFWDDNKTVQQESYSNLNIMEVSQLQERGGLEILSVEENRDGLDMPEFEGDDGVRYEVKAVRREGGVTIEAVPPEDFLLSSDHNSIDLRECRFCAHEMLITASDLIEQGFDKDIVDDLPAHEANDEEDYARNTLQDEYDDETSPDPSQRKIRFYECYIRVDTDDDGVAELRQINFAGDKILSNEECDTIPFSAISAIPQGHRFYGLSFYDRLKDIQEQKTITWRQVYDNMRQVNNVRHVVVQGKVNLDDMLNNRSGALIRAKNVVSPAEAIMPLPQAPMLQNGYQMLEYLDKLGEARSGVGANMMGQTQSMSGDTAHGVERIMSASEMLVGNIIRSIAETGMSDMFLKVRELLMKHQDWEKVIPVGEQDVTIDPSTWFSRSKTTVKVGLGTGDRIKQMGAMQQVLMFQEKLAVGGRDDLISPKKVYNALSDFGQYAGLVGVDQYFIDPDSQEAKEAEQAKQQQQPQPDPNMLLVEVESKKADAQVMKVQQDGQMKMQELEGKNADRQIQMQELMLKEREIAIREAELGIKREDGAGTLELKKYDIDIKASIEQAKLEQKNEEALINLTKERDRLEVELNKAMIEGSKNVGDGQKMPDVHIHNGGSKRIVVNRTVNGLEGFSESVDDNEPPLI